MENLSQELEFLDLCGLSESEKHLLQDVLTCATIPFFWEELTNKGCETETVPDQENVLEDGGEVDTSSFPKEVEAAIPATITYTPTMYPPGVAVPTSNLVSPYPPMVNYPVAMMSGTHIIGPGPSFYVNNMTANVNVHSSPYMPARLPSPAPFPVTKRKNFRPKYMVKKDVPNGHVGEGYPNLGFPHSSYLGHYFTGNIVQAATGVPFVMHQPISQYIPPHNIHVPQPSPPVYPVVTLAAPFHQEPEAIEIPPKVVVEIKEEMEEVKIEPEIAPVAEEVVVETAYHNEVEEKVSTPPLVVDAVIEEKQPETPPAPKSWASLFKPASNAATDKPTARVEPFSPAVDSKSEISGIVPRPVVDAITQQLAQHLHSYDILNAPNALLPRGLTNKGNWCYINATLQALIACPPFVHFMKSLVPLTLARTGSSSTPVIDSVLEFISQFETIPVRSRKDRVSAKKEDHNFGNSFEPSSIYKMLSTIRSEAFKVEGRQEDAEEFLSCLLNGLHDEMIDIMKVLDDGTSKITIVDDAQSSKVNVHQEDEDWQVIGPKNRGCVTRSATYSKTPISHLFLGQMRSALYQAGAQSTATLQPFFSLQLDIQNEKVSSVRDALECLVSKEPLTGYVCSKTGQVVEASRQTTLEELPPILILHLKCFVYDKSGGCQKLLKRVDFSADLEIGKELLSPTQKSKVKERQRQYKLFAVVYHDGKEATKGHYVTEVNHAGVGTWLRFDDSIVRPITDQFKYSPPRMPYLLLYRRADTFVTNATRAPANPSPNRATSSTGRSTNKP